MQFSQQSLASLVLTSVLAIVQTEALAIRPFVTDDARLVGAQLGQVESWLVLDKQKSAHNTLFAVGPTEWLEITSGFTHGGGYRGLPSNYGITGGIFQLKALARETKSNDFPGVAFAVGIIPPFGFGSPKPDGVSMFGYGALTQSFFNDDLLFHANLGVTAIKEETQWKPVLTSGFGFQAKVIGNFNAIGEIYRGDPYDPTKKAMASQVGFRHLFSSNFQLDGTFGSTLERDSHQWVSLGIRIVFPVLW